MGLFDGKYNNGAALMDSLKEIAVTPNTTPISEAKCLRDAATVECEDAIIDITSACHGGYEASAKASEIEASTPITVGRAPQEEWPEWTDKLVVSLPDAQNLDAIAAEADECIEAVNAAAREFVAAEIAFEAAATRRGNAMRELRDRITEGESWIDKSPTLPMLVDGRLIEAVGKRGKFHSRPCHVVPLQPSKAKSASLEPGDVIPFESVPFGHTFCSIEGETLGGLFRRLNPGLKVMYLGENAPTPMVPGTDFAIFKPGDVIPFLSVPHGHVFVFKDRSRLDGFQYRKSGGNAYRWAGNYTGPEWTLRSLVVPVIYQGDIPPCDVPPY